MQKSVSRILLNILWKPPVDHSEHTEYKLDRLLAARRGWVVLNWVIKMKEYPGFADKLKISTWAKPGCSLQATRYFTMEYEDGTTAAEAVSRWAFLVWKRGTL